MIDNFIKQFNINEEKLIKELHSYAYISKHKKGEFLIKQNQYIRILKIVLSGKVRIYQKNEDREILIYYLKDMETCTLSLSACFGNCKSTVYAIVEEDTTVLNIPIRFIKEWNYQYKSWNNFTINTFRESYNVLIHSYSRLAFQPLKERLLNYLISQSEESIIKKSHQQLAKELGTTREVVSRLLKKLELNGNLHLGLKEIKILKQ